MRRARGWSWGQLVSEPIRFHGDRMRACEVPGCEEPDLARGFCQGHYTRWRNGFSEEEMRLPLWES